MYVAYDTQPSCVSENRAYSERRSKFLQWFHFVLFEKNGLDRNVVSVLLKVCASSSI